MIHIKKLDGYWNIIADMKNCVSVVAKFTDVQKALAVQAKYNTYFLS